LAAQYGFHLSREDLGSSGALAGSLLVSYDEVERLHAASRPAPPQRSYQWPAESKNDLGAWYVTTEITARADGPLAGRRVAVKDNKPGAGGAVRDGSGAGGEVITGGAARGVSG